MMQGDAYLLPIHVEIEGETIDANMFSDIEISIGPIRKYMVRGDIEFNEETKDFEAYLTQKETFKLGKKEKVQIRFKFNSGDVIGVNLGEKEIVPSLSKVEL